MKLDKALLKWITVICSHKSITNFGLAQAKFEILTICTQGLIWHWLNYYGCGGSNARQSIRGLSSRKKNVIQRRFSLRIEFFIEILSVVLNILLHFPVLSPTQLIHTYYCFSAVAYVITTLTLEKSSDIILKSCFCLCCFQINTDGMHKSHYCTLKRVRWVRMKLIF